MRRSMTVRVVGPEQWILIPAAAALAAVLVLSTPIRVFGLFLPEPVFPMVLAFAWPLIRPSVFAPLTLGVLGLALDLVWYTPIGLWALSLLAVYALVLTFRNLLAGQESVFLFFWYLAGCVLAFLIAWLIVSAKAGNAPSLVAVSWQLLVTVVLFPLVQVMLKRFDDGDVRFR